MIQVEGSRPDRGAQNCASDQEEYMRRNSICSKFCNLVMLNGFVHLIGLKSDLLRSGIYLRFSLTTKQSIFSFRSFDLNSSVSFVNMRGKVTKSGEQVVIFTNIF